jgi:hypothetical protein
VLVDFPDGPWETFAQIARDHGLTAFRLAPVGRDRSILPSAYAAALAAEISTFPVDRVVIVGSCAAAAMARQTAYHLRRGGVVAESISVDGQDLDAPGLEQVRHDVLTQLGGESMNLPIKAACPDDWFDLCVGELSHLAASSRSVAELPASIVGQLLARLTAWLRHCTASYVCARSSNQTTSCTAAEANAAFEQVTGFLTRVVP